MPSRRNASPSVPAKAEGKVPTAAEPGVSDSGVNSASELIEAPQTPGSGKLDPHDFADGGGGGGAEAFSRKKTR